MTGASREADRNTCSICGAYGVNKRTCPETTRLEHEQASKPKITRIQQPATHPDNWGDLVAWVPVVDEEVEEVEEAVWEHCEPQDDEEPMPIQTAINEIAKDIRDIREIIEAIVRTIV